MSTGYQDSHDSSKQPGSAADRGAAVVASEGYLPTEQDFRSTLVRVRDAGPDALILISYYPDGAQIVRQARTMGLTQPVVATGSVYSPKFLELGGPEVEGVYTNANFFPEDPRPVVQRFVAGFRAMYGGVVGSEGGLSDDELHALETLMIAVIDGLAVQKLLDPAAVRLDVVLPFWEKTLGLVFADHAAPRRQDQARDEVTPA